MNLRKIAPETGKNTKMVPTISINAKGRIGFNTAARELTGIAEGSAVNFYQDVDNPENWYLAVEAVGSKVRETRSCTLLQNMGLCKVIMRDLKVPASVSTVYLKLAGEPTIEKKQKYYGILTNSITWKGKI
jgi:hypothetical protein